MRQPPRAQPIAHDTTPLIISGTFTAPRFVASTGSDGGALERDGAGNPIAHEIARLVTRGKIEVADADALAWALCGSLTM